MQHSNRKYVLVVGLTVTVAAAAAGLIEVVKERDRVARCADQSAEYVELAADLDRCAKSRDCMVTGKDILELRRVRSNAAHSCSRREAP